jgi:hypothetical protein
MKVEIVKETENSETAKRVHEALPDTRFFLCFYGVSKEDVTEVNCAVNGEFGPADLQHIRIALDKLEIRFQEMMRDRENVGRIV